MPLLRGLAASLCLALAAAAQDAAADIAARFSPHDVDGDGTAELLRLEPIGGAGEPAAPRVVVLVEARLLAAREGVPADAVAVLRERLARLLDDLAAEGHRADALAVAAHSGERHQDGRILLALRRLLQAFRESGPLRGAILVGHFPDALLLRTCNWRRGDSVRLTGLSGVEQEFSGYLRAVPENVAWKCDLVLADLDGGWEGLYFEPELELPSLLAAFDGGGVPDGGGAALAWRVGSLRFRDAFHVADGSAVVDAATGRVTIDDQDRDHECTADDRAAPNPIAQPEIAVSRIDARGVAWSPGPRFVDEDGRPRAVSFAAGERPPKWHETFVPDPALELRLLTEYLDRNHAFRTTPLDPAADKPASAAFGLGSGMRSSRRAKPAWREFDERDYDLTQDVDLLALLEWWRRPAVLRTLRAHSDPFAAVFAKTEASKLDAAVGRPWAFRPDGRSLVPSLGAACGGGRADFFYYRSLWQNGLLPAQGYLLVHTGCEAISPHGATTLRYDDLRYGVRQHAEAILFYTPCVALVGRAKVFYDEPRGFSEVLAQGGTVGDAWRRYFELESGSTWGQAGGDIGRKRAYFWSLLGDFTLRLP